jgi:pyruvate-ferredoxin/flavodoxin oxidoreductase
LDSKAPSIPLKDYAYAETRFKMLTLSKPEEASRLLQLAQNDVRARYQFYKQLAGMSYVQEEAQ